MNEYPGLFGETLVKGRFVKNDEFLNRLRKNDAAFVRTFFRIKERVEGPGKYREKGSLHKFLNVLFLVLKGSDKGRNVGMSFILLNPFSQWRSIVGEPTARAFTADGLDYNRAMEIDHINPVRQLEKAIRRYFKVLRKLLFPGVAPGFHLNLVTAYHCVKRGVR